MGYLACIADTVMNLTLMNGLTAFFSAGVTGKRKNSCSEKYKSEFHQSEFKM